MNTISRQRSVSGQPAESHPRIHKQPQQHQYLLQPDPESLSEIKSSSRTYIELDQSHHHLKPDSLDHALPRRKMSGTNLFKMARQASDNAFRTVKLNRKASESHLMAARKAEQPETSGVYEQNPKVYLYQQQQHQKQQRNRPHSDDTMAEDWECNNRLLHSPSNQAMDYLEPPPADLLKPGDLRRNVSLPDMKNVFVKDAYEPATVRATSPGTLLLPGQAPNRNRSRQRVQPHHFNAAPSSQESTLFSNPSSPSDLTPPTPDDLRPPTPQRSPSRALRRQKSSGGQDHQRQLRGRFLTRHLVLSDESLSEYPEMEGSSPRSKELPPTPPGPPLAFQQTLRSRCRFESNDPDPLPVPVLPIASEMLRKKENCGIIPQDLLKSMDPKDVQKAVSASVIASRVYKVLSPDQLDTLRKEQEDLQQFVEAMNVALHVESRMRDASHSLIRLHESTANMSAVKAATSQLNTTTRKMDQIVQRTQQAMWRLLAIQRLLYQHEGAVLNAGLRRLDGENRELSRSVMQLEAARDLEKEEKLKWKKEHNRLKVESILLTGISTIAEESMPDVQQVQQQHHAKLESMESYAKELNEHIMQKDEELEELKAQLGSARAWADDFYAAIQARKQAEEDQEDASHRLPHTSHNNATLQEGLCQLQSTVETELKELDVHNQELAARVEQLTDENSLLICGSPKPASLRVRQRTVSTDSNNSSNGLIRVDTHLSRMIQHEQNQDKRARRSWRVHAHAMPHDGSDLRSVLRESLLELDQRIRSELANESSSRSSLSSCRTSATSESASSVRLGLNQGHCELGLAIRDVRLDEDAELALMALSSEEEDCLIEDANKEIQRLNEMMFNAITIALMMVLFKGAVYERGSECFDCRAYQYATTSFKDTGSMDPAYIVYAQGDPDVLNAISLARSHSIAIAIRTGGHQYCGASSTSGNNIQLDLSKTYPTVEWEDPEANDYTVVTFGVSTSLGELNSKLREHGRFVPTGQCSYVNLGGHCQTGGYGASIRSFGLLSDHIQKLRIATADKEVPEFRWIHRHSECEEEKELFYSVVGGSPGNFGVISHVTLQVHRDEDHLLSRAVRGRIPYDRNVLKQLLDLVVEMGDDDEFPADYDVVITMTSERPAQYADTPEEAKIVIWAQWANLEGAGQVYDPTFFQRLIDIASSNSSMTPHERVLLQDEAMVMSELNNHWIVPIVREFQLPYIKNVKLSDLPSSELRARKYTEWVTERVDRIEANTQATECYLVHQFAYGGGRHSRARNGDDGLTSFSWRDSSFLFVLDVFYNGEKPKVKEFARQYQKETEKEALGEGGKFSSQDRRLLWGSQDSDLHAAREYYFDEAPTKYERLAANKARFDPLNVFTANKFSVQAPAKEGAMVARFKGTVTRLWQTLIGTPGRRSGDRGEAMTEL
ncbi:hypothetical protein EC968_006445 [Mortierella alpina]|nr:hypothetical protein EC968_006445 [Mortierella alpina]